MNSTYLFVLESPDKRLNYQVQHYNYDESVVFEIYLYGMGIWLVNSGNFSNTQEYVKNLSKRIIMFYELHSLKPHEYRFKNWIEIKDKDIVFADNVLGFYLDQFSSGKVLKQNNHKNKLWKTALLQYKEITTALEKHPDSLKYFELALEDFSKGLSTNSRDYAVYLFRSLEELRKSVWLLDSENNDEDNRDEQWENFHNNLNTSKSKFEDLTNRSKQSRHGETFNTVEKDKDISLLQKTFKKYYEWVKNFS